MEYSIPRTQRAVQLTGPDQLRLNTEKPVPRPGPNQILCRVEATGLCFSDLKLLKQFSSHVRKGKILSGVGPEVLENCPNYVPDEQPTVPGHEAVVRVWAVGENVTRYKPGERYLIQADYRWVRTATTNGAFGYNFEGGLQEYVLVDERIITSPDGDSTLVPATEDLSAAAVALVEPWGCVEDAYVTKERLTLKEGEKMLVVAESEVDTAMFNNFLAGYGKPGQITWVSQSPAPEGTGVEISAAADITGLEDAAFDDVIYFGSDAAVLEEIFPKIGLNGLINIALCGGELGRPISFKIGRVHYGGVRIIGTTGCNPAVSMEYIPKIGEVRPGDKVNVVGAAGPMGIMHVIRVICHGVEDVSVFAGDLDNDRLAALSRIAGPLAETNKVTYRPYNPKADKIDEKFDYVALMAPVPALVNQAVHDSGKRALINIFAGIPATVTGEIDLDTYIKNEQYFIGTSGSTLDDMRMVLKKVESGQLDTNISVAAISGLEGAIDGIRAVENRSIAGKILVYPCCKGLGLVRLEELKDQLPEVAEALVDGVWNMQAEKALLEHYTEKK